MFGRKRREIDRLKNRLAEIEERAIYVVSMGYSPKGSPSEWQFRAIANMAAKARGSWEPYGDKDY